MGKDEDMTNMAIVQWFLIIWLLTILAKCIFEIFDKEPPSGLFFGLILIVVGFFWFLNLKNSVFIKSWISGFYISSLIGIILISGGIRILLKAPIRSYIAALIIISFSLSMYYYGPTQRNKPSFFDFLNQSKPGHFWNENWFHDSSFDSINSKDFQFYGEPTEKELSLEIKKGNVNFSTREMNYLFSAKGVSKVEQNKKDYYQIESAPNEDVDIVVNENMVDLEIELISGNLNGILNQQMNKMMLKTDTGNIKIILKKTSNDLSLLSRLGNISLFLHEPVDAIDINTMIGNIEIHIKKGMAVDIRKIESGTGKINIPAEINQSVGKAQMKVKTDIGNISIIDDL